MTAVRKADEGQALYDKFDNVVRELSALRDLAEEEARTSAREGSSMPAPADRDSLAAFWSAGEDEADYDIVRELSTLRDLAEKEAPSSAGEAPFVLPPAADPEPLSPTRLGARELADGDPLAAYGSVAEGDAEPRRRKPMLAAVVGIICAGSALALGVGAGSFVGRQQGDRLAEPQRSAVAATAATTLTGPVMVQAPAGPEAAGWERAAFRRTETELPRPPDVVPHPPSAPPAAEQRIPSDAPDEGTQTAPVVTTGTIRPHVTPAPAVPPAMIPATSPPPPAESVASAQPEGEAAAPPTPEEIQMAALWATLAPAPQWPGFPAEEIGRRMARARSIFNRTADIVGAWLLLPREADRRHAEVALFPPPAAALPGPARPEPMAEAPVAPGKPQPAAAAPVPPAKPEPATATPVAPAQPEPAAAAPVVPAQPEPPAATPVVPAQPEPAAAAPVASAPPELAAAAAVASAQPEPVAAAPVASGPPEPPATPAAPAQPEPAAAAPVAPARPEPAAAAPVAPAQPEPAAAAPVASAQPEPVAAAPVAPARPEPPRSVPPPAPPESQIAALPRSAPTVPVQERPRFSAEETGRLIARARSLIDTTSDIAGARLLLQRAADRGDPAAAFALAETFDPNVLSRMRVFGIRGDAALARRLYQQALDGGVENARPRLTALGD